jgi:hypothetical protein
MCGDSVAMDKFSSPSPSAFPISHGTVVTADTVASEGHR